VNAANLTPNSSPINPWGCLVAYPADRVASFRFAVNRPPPVVGRQGPYAGGGDCITSSTFEHRRRPETLSSKYVDRRTRILGCATGADEAVAQIAALAAHQDVDARPTQAVYSGKRRELAPRSRFMMSEAVDRFVQRFDAEVGVQSVRYPPRQNHTGVPIHDRHQVEEPSAHWQICDVQAPDLV
jgi:hypothetical protein